MMFKTLIYPISVTNGVVCGNLITLGVLWVLRHEILALLGAEFLKRP